MGAASVWTGTEIIIAGGTRDDVAGLGEEAQASNSDGVRIKVTNFADGAAYDPGTDRWRPIAAAPVDALADDAIWTGRVMLVRGILAPADPNDAPTAHGPANPSSCGAGSLPTTASGKRQHRVGF